MLKHKELADPTSCLNRSKPDEPIFVLCARDPVAAMTIRHWVTMSEGVHSPDKRQHALASVRDFETWLTQQPTEAQERAK